MIYTNAVFKMKGLRETETPLRSLYKLICSNLPDRARKKGVIDFTGQGCRILQPFNSLILFQTTIPNFVLLHFP